MIFLGISGSPRKGGNSDLLLDRALEGAKSKGSLCEKIVLNDLNFKPCQECGGCNETGECVIQDDMQLIYKKVDAADRIIVASPIFFGTLSAQVKMMIDRFQCAWARKYLLKTKPLSGRKKKGIFLCVGAEKSRRFFENARDIIKIFYGVLDIKYAGELFLGGVDKKGAVKREKKTLDKVFKMGVVLAEG